MAYFKFKATPTIASYFPLLLKKQWWHGYKDTTNGTVFLLEESPYTNLNISVSDIDAEKQTLDEA